MVPGDISGGEYGTVGFEHSYVVMGMVNVESYVVEVLCFRLRLIVSPYSADGLHEEQPHLLGGGGEPYHISYIGTSPHNLLWLRCGSGRGTAKIPLQSTRTGRPVRPGTVLALGCARQGQCR